MSNRVLLLFHLAFCSHCGHWQFPRVKKEKTTKEKGEKEKKRS
jgi:hypothetical protein